MAKHVEAINASLSDIAHPPSFNATQGCTDGCGTYAGLKCDAECHFGSSNLICDGLCLYYCALVGGDCSSACYFYANSEGCSPLNPWSE